MNPTRNQGEALPYRKPLVLQLEALKVGFPVPKGFGIFVEIKDLIINGCDD